MQTWQKIFGLFFVMGMAFASNLNAATFEVATNADSGPGSLRDAILQANANGTSEIDYIVFKINALSTAEVNIVLATELPALTSNIVIDGSTEIFALLNSTSIKIQLTRGSPDFISGFVIKGVHHIEIYGISFIGFETGLATPTCGAIFLNNGSDIIIGGPNRGNSFGKNYAGIFSPPENQLNERIKIQSNYFGFAPDGVLVNSNSNGIDISYCKDLLVGGTTAEANFFGKNTTSAMSIGGSQGIARIANNRIGLDVIGQYIPTNTAVGIYANGLKSTTTIEDNIVVGQRKGLVVQDVGMGFSIKRNRIGTGLLGTEAWGNLEVGIEIYQGNAGTIGGLADADRNYIAYNRDAIFVVRAYPITITKNSVYCNSRYAIKFEDVSPENLAKISVPNVIKVLPNAVNGTYNPGAIVEIFEDDQCPGCQGKKFIASRIPDVSGNWSYNGTINGPITVTGTNGDGATSAFSSPSIDETFAKPTDDFCGKSNGTIKGINVFNADEFTWYNEQGDIVGHERELIGAKAGKYHLVAKQQGNCEISSSVFKINPIDAIYKLKDSRVSPTACGKATGSIEIKSFEFAIPAIFTWRNEKGDVLSSEQSINGLAKGTYRLYGANGFGCENLIGTFDIEEAPDMVLNTSKLVIYNTSCLKDEGSIFNLAITGGTAPYTYEWFDERNHKVGDELILLTMPSAKYYLKITDANGCYIQSTPFTIPQSPLNVKLPDSFSPNGDGVNDIWRVPGIGSFRNTEIKIFNRYGAIVFLSRNNEKEFDGRHDDKDLPVGMYYYIVKLNNNCSDIRGHIMLIR